MISVLALDLAQARDVFFSLLNVGRSFYHISEGLPTKSKPIQVVCIHIEVPSPQFDE